jgi:hypothetical protein
LARIGAASCAQVATAAPASTAFLCLRGGFDLRDCYSAMDVVAYEGQGYTATRDNPGVPGVDDGWLLVAVRGAKGERGEPGKLANVATKATGVRPARRLTSGGSPANIFA